MNIKIDFRFDLENDLDVGHDLGLTLIWPWPQTVTNSHAQLSQIIYCIKGSILEFDLENNLELDQFDLDLNPRPSSIEINFDFRFDLENDLDLGHDLCVTLTWPWPQTVTNRHVQLSQTLSSLYTAPRDRFSVLTLKNILDLDPFDLSSTCDLHQWTLNSILGFDLENDLDIGHDLDVTLSWPWPLMVTNCNTKVSQTPIQPSN